MKKNKMIIIDGPQGTGKTTLANYLRENISGSNLYRLSGQKEKTIKGKKYSTIMYKALIDYFKEMQKVPMDLIFDRIFITEEVYARLGYKEYSFTDVFNELIGELLKLDYEIYYFSLYLKDEKLYEKRLARESHHDYQAFSIKNSADQQKIYLQLSDELEKKDGINVYKLSMDDFEESYKKINEILKIK